MNGELSYPDDVDDIVDLLCEQVPGSPEDDFYGGSWDIDYQDHSRSGWDPINHMENLTALSEAYITSGFTFNETCNGTAYTEADLVPAIINGLKFWYNYPTNPTCDPDPCPCATVCPCSENWWQHTIGKQRELHKISLFFWDVLSTNTDVINGKTLLEHIIDDLPDNYTDCNDFELYTGANLADNAGSMLIRGLLSNDPVQINNGLDALSLVLNFNPNDPNVPEEEREGIRRDYSFHQHGALLYNGGYGMSFLEIIAVWGASLANCDEDDDYFLPNETKERLLNFVLEGTRRMTAADNTDYSANGRDIARPYSGSNAAVPEWVLECLKLVAGTGTLAYDQLEAMRMAIDNKTLQSISGNKHFWTSDYVSHMEAGSYFSSIHMSSGRTIGTENENDENLLGYWLPFGCTFIFQDGDEYILKYDGDFDGNGKNDDYYNVFPQWDWAKVPGVTSPDVVPDLIDDSACDHSKNDDDFVGSTGNGDHSSSAMVLSDNYNCGGASGNIDGRKSWFHFGTEIIAVGSNITGNNPHTTINQCLMDGNAILDNGGTNTIEPGDMENTYSDVNYITHDNVAYVFPDKHKISISADPGMLNNDEVDWEFIHDGEDEKTPVADLFMARILHESANDGYYYIIAPGQSAGNYYPTGPVSKLLPDDDDVNDPGNIHAVVKDPGGDNDVMAGIIYFPTSTVFGDQFSPTAVDVGEMGFPLTLETNEPCALFYDQSNLEVCISSPDRAYEEIILTFDTDPGNQGGEGSITFVLPEEGDPFEGNSTCIPFSDFSLCFATSTTSLDARALLDGLGSHLWTVSPSNGVTISNPNSGTPTITFTTQGEYVIEHEFTLNGHSVTTEKTVTVPLDVVSSDAIISHSDDDPCNLDMVFTSHETEAISHNWSIENGSGNIIHTSSYQDFNFTFAQAGDYTVNYTATDACNMTKTATINNLAVTQHPDPCSGNKWFK